MTLAEESEKAFRLVTAPWRAVPSFLIAGAPKCGTSTLYDYIAAHPDVRRGRRKEPTNFLKYPGSRLRSAMNYPLRLGRRFIVGDGSVEYFAHPDGPRNVRAVLPDAKLIFVFRDPVRRAWSDYWMYRNFGTEKEEFDVVVRRSIEWLRDAQCSPLIEAASREAWNPIRYVRTGMYASLLERWLDCFPVAVSCFIVSEEFFNRPKDLVQQAYRHLGLAEFLPPEIPVARDGGIATQMDSETEQLLRDFYKPEVQALSKLIGRELPWNS